MFEKKIPAWQKGSRQKGGAKWTGDWDDAGSLGELPEPSESDIISTYVLFIKLVLVFLCSVVVLPNPGCKLAGHFLMRNSICLPVRVFPEVCELFPVALIPSLGLGRGSVLHLYCESFPNPFQSLTFSLKLLIINEYMCKSANFLIILQMSGQNISSEVLMLDHRFSS